VRIARRVRRAGRGNPPGAIPAGRPGPTQPTWPKRSSVPSHATAPAGRNHPRNPIPAPRRRRPRHPRKQAWPHGPGPGTPRFTRRWLAADHHPDQPHLTAGTQDRAPLRHRGPPDLLPRLTPAGPARPASAYLRQRWDEGCHSTKKLHQELRARQAHRRPPAALAQITTRCEELAATRDLVREFADLLCHRHGEHLETWAAQAETSPVSGPRGFAKGLRKDWAAVTAGLTVSYSSGAVEGHVNRIKMIKRQMYGRANPDLLRKRILLAD
jgi:hypothetical protein